MAEKGQWREASKHHREATEKSEWSGRLGDGEWQQERPNKIGGEKSRVTCEEVTN